MTSFIVRVGLPKGSPFEQRELISALLLRMASSFSFQGMEDWKISLQDEKVLGIADEFHDLTKVKRPEGTFVLYFGSARDAASFAKWVRGSIAGLTVSLPRKQKERDWMKEWRRHYKPVQVGKGDDVLWIYPAWMKIPPARRARSIRIHPGQAFGTGTHPTTKLCLELFLGVRKLLPEKSNIMDFGAGTGVLALGAAHALGGNKGCFLLTEIDAKAREQCRKNLRLNGEKFPVVKHYAGKKKFSLVFANVLSPVLLEEARSLEQRLEEGAYLILSGILKKEAAIFLREFQKRAKALKHRSTKLQGDWAAFLFTKASR